MIQFNNRMTDLNEIWYERYAIRVYLKIVLFSFIQKTNMADERIYEMGSTLAPLNYGDILYDFVHSWFYN